jgi:hypothetical protein
MSIEEMDAERSARRHPVPGGYGPAPAFDLVRSAFDHRDHLTEARLQRHAHLQRIVGVLTAGRIRWIRGRLIKAGEPGTTRVNCPTLHHRPDFDLAATFKPRMTSA